MCGHSTAFHLSRESDRSKFPHDDHKPIRSIRLQRNHPRARQPASRAAGTARAARTQSRGQGPTHHQRTDARPARSRHFDTRPLRLPPALAQPTRATTPIRRIRDRPTLLPKHRHRPRRADHHRRSAQSQGRTHRRNPSADGKPPGCRICPQSRKQTHGTHRHSTANSKVTTQIFRCKQKHPAQTGRV